MQKISHVPGALCCTLRLSALASLVAGAGPGPRCLGVHNIEHAGPVALHRQPALSGEVDLVAAYLDDLHPGIRWEFQCPPGAYRVFVKYSSGAMSNDIWVKVNDKRLLLPETGSRREFLWSEALELKLGPGHDTSIKIHEVAVHALVGSGIWSFIPVDAGSILLFQAVSIEMVGEKQISTCMACQILVVDSMLSNVHNSLLVLDGSLSPSKRPDLWTDKNGNPRNVLPGEDFDVIHLKICSNTTWLMHYSRVLQVSARSIEDACKRVFLEDPLQFSHIIHKQRARKGLAEARFAATFEAYCIKCTGSCTPEESMSGITYLDLCGPLWNRMMCLERMDPPDHWKKRSPADRGFLQASQLPIWWSDVVSGFRRFHGHPFLKKVIGRVDYQRILHEATERSLHRRDNSLPVEKSAFLYLCQASHIHRLSMLYGLFPSTSSALLVTTWKFRTHGAIYFPNSTLAEGRQVLFAAARLQERRQGWRYVYWIMLDDDVAFLRGGPREFEAFLSAWEPAVAVPADYWHHARFREYQLETSEAYAAYHVDHQVIAYHHETIDELWPFDLRWDTECWWASQWHQGVLASVKYRGHVLVSKKVVVLNPVHNPYPKASYQEAFDNATFHLQSLLPAEVRHCARYVNATETGLPWGKPMRKSGRYDNWALDGLEQDCSYNITGDAAQLDQPRWPMLQVDDESAEMRDVSD